MKQNNITRYRPSEKDVIDALLKISEIVQKTEVNQQHNKLINTNKFSKKAVGDGDYNDNLQQQVPMPPPMRTLDSYVSGLNQSSLQKASNCNQISIRKSRQHSSDNKKQLPNSNDSKNRKRDFLDMSSSDDYSHRKKSISHRSSQSNQIENHPIITNFHSEIDTILDGQSSSLTMTPIASVPIIEQQESEILKNSKIDCNIFLDKQLQATLEKYLKTQLLSSTNEKFRLSNFLTKSETEKLLDDFHFINPICNLEHYEKQRELAILAAKEGNYTLSYSIYTNLLYDNQYDYKLKSEILSFRATILLLEQKCFESIDDCTQAIAYNQWNKLAYIVRAACWMIKQEYLKAINDYSKLFHFFDQSQHVLDLLNLAYEKFSQSIH